MTDWDPRTIKVSFDFLGTGNYKAEVWKDASDSDKEPEHLVKESMQISRQDTKDFNLAPGGGFVLHIFPE